MAGEQQLSHRPHHHIGKEPDQHIDNQDRGAGDGDVAPRPHKQPGADGAPRAIIWIWRALSPRLSCDAPSPPAAGDA